MKLKNAFFVLFAFISSSLFSQEIYTFTDINSLTLDAEYLYMQDNVVRLLTPNKKIVKVDFDCLSPESQKLILKLQWKEDLLSGKIKPVVHHSSPQKTKKTQTPEIPAKEPEEVVVSNTPTNHKQTQIENQTPVIIKDNVRFQDTYTPTHTAYSTSKRPLPELDQTKPVRVRSYTRVQNGKIVPVRSHTRHSPGTAPKKSHSY